MSIPPTVSPFAAQTLAPPGDGLLLAAPGSKDEVIYRNERTLIARRHLANGDAVVLKQAFGNETQARLRHEGRVLQRLAGVDGVIHLYPQQPADGLALVDVDSVSLAHVLLEGRPGVPAVLAIAIELAQTLATVHRLGVIHKDINPSNVLLVGAERRALLIDFNIATCFAEERPGFVHQSDIAGTRPCGRSALRPVRIGRDPVRNGRGPQALRDRRPAGDDPRPSAARTHAAHRGSA
jgi:serine/threonine protein kinase